MKFTPADERVFNAFCAVAREAQGQGDITMPKIAAKMGISKQALYQSYFRNVDEIVNALHTFVLQDTKAKVEDYIRLRRKNLLVFISLDVLTCLYDKRAYLQVLYQKHVDSTWIDAIEETFLPLLKPYFELSEKKIGLESEFLARLVIRQFSAILAEWMKSDNPENPVTFQKKFAYLFSHSTHELLIMGSKDYNQKPD